MTIPAAARDKSSHPSCSCVASKELLPTYSASAQASLAAEAAAHSVPFAKSDLMQDVSASIAAQIKSLDAELRDLSVTMHENPEVKWEEHKTHDLFVKYFQGKKGWKVTPHAYTLETAWEAVFEHSPSGAKGQDLLTIGFNSEMDALPGIGHACGHNLIAIGGIAAALSVAAALVKHDIAGRVILLGTPAEEGDGGKIVMLKEGAYKSMLACLMIHPAPSSTTGPMLATIPATATFTGRTSHAGAAPSEGINAQDAAVLAYMNMSALRQQLEGSVRTHGIIVADEWAPNVIPGKSHLEWVTRATDVKALKEVHGKIKRCWEGAALATGCKLEIAERTSYFDLRNQATLAADFRHYMKEEYKQDFQTHPWPASTDFGNVTYALPALHPAYQIPLSDPKTQGNHTVGFTEAAKTPEAHQLTLKAATGIAVTGARMIVEPEFRTRVTEEWKEWKKQVSA
ncbi:unnamed protein product [Parajaminaea phylloscopi]